VVDIQSGAAAAVSVDREESSFEIKQFAQNAQDNPATSLDVINFHDHPLGQMG
jgi:hypothetical protein